jgi:hypothetical protein
LREDIVMALTITADNAAHRKLGAQRGGGRRREIGSERVGDQDRLEAIAGNRKLARPFGLQLAEADGGCEKLGAECRDFSTLWRTVYSASILH